MYCLLSGNIIYCTTTTKIGNVICISTLIADVNHSITQYRNTSTSNADDPINASNNKINSKTTNIAIVDVDHSRT